MNIYELTYPSGSGTPDQPVVATAVVIAGSCGEAVELLRLAIPRKRLNPEWIQIGFTLNSFANPRVVCAEL